MIQVLTLVTVVLLFFQVTLCKFWMGTLLR